ncbi:glycosyltransferase family 2 protein [Allorhodopirellula heiligendammensis]|uniref:N-glycosyltransferase n=1 Tax=Allorhodopirellula heiligendammensis TaxID=2714739 RepID=A0A5C6C0E2_9BACT|nr:glycosyltransferase [Allorhodopirellula heiligendammensis]TWU16986.1 N-glycosyltransferase [Allorhodopirellula heiligendammensis]
MQLTSPQDPTSETEAGTATEEDDTRRVSVIVPTIGRPESLQQLLSSLAFQTQLPTEVLIADGSQSTRIHEVAHDPRWGDLGLTVHHIQVSPPNAVRQRKAAISQATGECLLLLDDDVVLEQDCIAEMMNAMLKSSNTVAVVADFNNQTWAMPTRAWKTYLKLCCGLSEGEWQGRVIGPLLRYGYNPTPAEPMPMEWLGAGMSLVKASAYHASGGFSDFFLRRCTMNEDVDLGLKLTRQGAIIFCPTARLGHFHAPGGRMSARYAAEDDLYNRYLIMRRTQMRSPAGAFGLAMLYFSVETASSFVGCIRRVNSDGFFSRTCGRFCALARILFGSTTT